MRSADRNVGAMKKLVLAALAGRPVAFPARAADETRGRPDWIGWFDPGPLTNGVVNRRTDRRVEPAVPHSPDARADEVTE